MAPRAKAVVMLSGGLDSALAAKVLADQGVEVIGVHFNTGFCVVETKAQTARPDVDPMKLVNRAQLTGGEMGVRVREVDISEEFLDVVMNPPHGYGSRVNPCIDCRILMLKRSAEIMREEGADFVATGEVLGQRPMSQHRGALRVVERDSGLDGKLVRPLCALRLPESEPEMEGKLDRSKLLGLTGRGRRRQLDLAREAGLEGFAPAGGGCCFLTDPAFARKFKDRVSHRGEARLGWEDMTLLKVGRHFRLSPRLKLIVGRHEAENMFLERFRSDRTWFEPESVMGPIALADEGCPTPEEELLCAAILARFSRGRRDASVAVTVGRPGGVSGRLDVAPLADEGLLDRARV